MSRSLVREPIARQLVLALIGMTVFAFLSAALAGGAGQVPPGKRNVSDKRAADTTLVIFP